ncbi:MAG TPA: DUF5654 family protein [Patescibacteria group bacterium]|nr:DUF5654 family protein [Patescibacteria group bacterium]
MAKAEMSKKKKLRLEILRQMIALSTAGFGLVAALAWNSLIQEIVNNYIKKYLPGDSGIISLFIYAIVVTIIAVFVTFQLTGLVEKVEHE